MVAGLNWKKRVPEWKKCNIRLEATHACAVRTVRHAALNTSKLASFH
jgi:hypothetical protein